MKPTIQLRPGESPSAAITRLYRHIRKIQHNYQPSSHYTSRAQLKHATRRLGLRVVK